MAYVIERNDRFYVVAYDGNDPRTGREKRRWHPAGRSREDAEAIAARLRAERDNGAFVTQWKGPAPCRKPALTWCYVGGGGRI
jgi:hypothetical protein